MSGVRRGISIPYEAQVFSRMAVFGLVVGAGYWFLTYETAGSVLLVAFGIASAVATVAISLGSRRGRPHGPPGTTAAAEPPTGLPHAEPIPSPGWTPIAISIGLGGLALGLAFGPWLLIAGLGVTLVGAKAWLDATIAETDAARGRTGPLDPPG